MTTTPQQQPDYARRYFVTQGTQHTYIEDNEGNYLAKTIDTSAKNHQRLRALVAAANSVAGLSDPAAALQAAREALERIVDVPAVHFTEDVIDNASRTMEEVRKIARQALQQLNGEAQP